MITIRATKKLLDKLKATPATVLPVPTGRLGTWYADVRAVGRQHIVVLVNEATLMSLIIPWSEFKGNPVAAMHTSLRALLLAISIPASAVDEELATITGVTFTKTASKVMLGRMNAPALMIEMMVTEGMPFHEIEMRMIGYFYMPTSSDPEPDIILPNRRTYDLFGIDGSAFDDERVVQQWLNATPVPTATPMPTATPASTVPPASTVSRAPIRRPVRLTDTLILRIELEGIRPEIWRTVMVPAKITLRRLHDVIQAAMGWDDSHLHSFTINGKEYADTSVMDHGFYASPNSNRVKEERSVTLYSFPLASLETFTYLYDMGDSWKHTISVIGTDRVEHDTSFRVIDGANACPPEDVGGVHGYAWFVLAMMHPQYEDHQQVLEWFGRPFDHTMFDLRAAQRLLHVIVYSGAGYPWKK